MVSHTFGIDLAMVPLANVHPHEAPDANRVTRLEARIEDEKLLRDPIMVAGVNEVEGFVLLDGTNRRAALERLGCERVLAQIVDYEDANCVNLLTWSHLVDLGVEDLLTRIARIDGLDISALDQAKADSALDRLGSLAAVHHGNKSWLVRQAGEDGRRSSLLTDLVAVYEDYMQREARDRETIEQKLDEVRSRPGGHDWPLVTFPHMTKQQVTELAVNKTPIPAGISRHVMRCGRALRVNVPLTWLAKETTQTEAEDTLQRHLSALRPRRYLEPTILFDS